MSSTARASWRSPRSWLLPVVMVGGVGVVVLLGRGPHRQFVRYPEAEAAAVSDPHAYQGQPLCQRCHPTNDRRVDGDPSALCLACHTRDGLDHPLRVVVPDAIRTVLPLAAGRTVACHTCHDPHAVYDGAYGLRASSGRLCVPCHPDK